MKNNRKPFLPEKLQLPCEMLFGALLGFTLFLSAYGWNVVNVFSTDWIMFQPESADIQQHFLGGMFYLKDSWHWPPFLLSGLTLSATNVLSVDAIPLCGLFFKLLYRGCFDGEMVQYLGVWGLFNFTMQGVMAALLCHKLIEGVYGRITGVLFLVLSVPLWGRFPIHTALSSHWLILWALWLWFQRFSGPVIAQWTLSIVLALLIHPYLAAILMALFLARILQGCRKRESRQLLMTGSIWVVIGSLAAFYLLGYFGYGVAAASWGGFGRVSMNLNALINPVEAANSKIFAVFPVNEHQANEGFMYLGAGVLLLIVLYSRRLWLRLMSPERREPVFWLLLCCAGLAMFALSNRVLLGELCILNIQLPRFILKFCHLFQASARFFWPVYYLIVVGVVKTVSEDPLIRRGALSLGAACLLQVYDVGLGTVVNQSSKIQIPGDENFKPILSGEVWENAAEGKTRIFCPGRSLNYIEVAYYALEHGLTLYDFRLTRRPGELDSILEEEREKLNRNEHDPKTLYLLDEEEHKALSEENPGLAEKFAKLDRWYVL